MKKVVLLLCAAALLMGMTSCSIIGSAAADDTVIVKYSTVFGATGAQADGARALGKWIESCSDGRMQMQFYSSSQLGDKIATFEGLQAGSMEMTECAATDLSGYDSLWSVFALPYLWESGEEAIQVVMDPEVSSYLSAEAEKYGFIIIAWTDVGSRSIINKNHTVNTPEDLVGLKLRCMEDTVLAASLNAMGAIATPLAASEVYTGLQQGTIDGTDHTPASVAANGWQELCKYYSITEHFTIPDPVFVSKKWFDGLSPENQQALLEAGQKFTEEWNNEIWPSATEKGLQTLREAGVEITEVDKQPFIEAVQPVVDDFLANATDAQKELYNLLVSVRDRQ